MTSIKVTGSVCRRRTRMPSDRHLYTQGLGFVVNVKINSVKEPPRWRFLGARLCTDTPLMDYFVDY